MVYLVVGESRKDHQLTPRIIESFILQAWVPFHTVVKCANLRSRQ